MQEEYNLNIPVSANVLETMVDVNNALDDLQNGSELTRMIQFLAFLVTEGEVDL